MSRTAQMATILHEGSVGVAAVRQGGILATDHWTVKAEHSAERALEIPGFQATEEGLECQPAATGQSVSPGSISVEGSQHAVGHQLDHPTKLVIAFSVLVIRPSAECRSLGTPRPTMRNADRVQ
jgi:hypothetical protein